MSLTYKDAVRSLELRGIYPNRPPSLVVMQEALKQTHLPPAKNVILVAGTNGKGSVASLLSHIIHQAGYKVGLFTSPHLVNTYERIKINQQSIHSEYFVELYSKFLWLTHLTHFEMLTLMAVEAFQSCDYCVFEVGLGGLWDATNAIPHQMSVITTIDYDHVEILGPTIKDIARNKAGILQQGLAFTFHQPEEIKEVFLAHANGCNIFFIEPPSIDIQPGFPAPLTSFLYKREKFLSPLIGIRGAKNTYLSLHVVNALGINFTQNSLSNFEWPGRFTVHFFQQRYFALSGDHNPEGILSLLDILKNVTANKFVFILGISYKKDLKGIEKILNDFKNQYPCTFILTESSHYPKSIDEFSLEAIKARDHAHAIELATMHSCPQDLIVITGSLYLVGDYFKYFNLSHLL